jgi:RNA polymerase sigma factor (sigma-70 family)
LTPSTDARVADGDLLRALADGEPHAVAHLYERYGSKMIAFARRYVGDEAEDVVDDLIQRWLEQPPQPRDPQRLSSFLAVSVYHAAIDWIRRQRSGQGQVPRSNADPARSGGTRAIPGAASSAHGTLETLKARLNAALERLSGTDRLLLESHYGRALTVEECMDILGISRPAFHQRLHRARGRLLRLLETT